MSILWSKFDFLSANFVFLVQNSRSYQPQITTEICSILRVWLNFISRLVSTDCSLLQPRRSDQLCPLLQLPNHSRTSESNVSEEKIVLVDKNSSLLHLASFDVPRNVVSRLHRDVTRLLLQESFPDSVVDHFCRTYFWLDVQKDRKVERIIFKRSHVLFALQSRPGLHSYLKVVESKKLDHFINTERI